MIDPHHNPDTTKRPADWLKEAKAAYERAAAIAQVSAFRPLTLAELRSERFWHDRGDEAAKRAGMATNTKEVGGDQ
jgi:hypothetical protein